jgi:hypothetical protein
VNQLSAVSDKLIDRTRQVWQSRMGRELSHEDARQIVENVTGFFSILYEWSRDERAVPANDSDTAHPESSGVNPPDFSTETVMSEGPAGHD